MSLTFLHEQRHRLPFAMESLFKKVYIANSLWRQRECFPPEQRAGMLAVQYKRPKFPKFKDPFLKCNPLHVPASIWTHLRCLPGIWRRGRTDRNMLSMLLAAVPWVISPTSLTQESHVISQHSWNYGRLTCYLINRIQSHSLHNSWQPQNGIQLKTVE